MGAPRSWNARAWTGVGVMERDTAAADALVLLARSPARPMSPARAVTFGAACAACRLRDRCTIAADHSIVAASSGPATR